MNNISTESIIGVAEHGFNLTNSYLSSCEWLHVLQERFAFESRIVYRSETFIKTSIPFSGRCLENE